MPNPNPTPFIYRHASIPVDQDVDKIKVQLLEQLRFAIYDVQSATAGSSNGTDTSLTRSDPSVKELCRAIDKLLRLDLKSGSDDYWYVIYDHLSKEDLKSLVLKWKPKSNRGSCLSWIYQSLNDGLMSWQILSFCNAQYRLSKMYNYQAFVLDKDALTLASEMLAALDGMSFDLSPPKPEDRPEHVKIDEKIIPIAQRRPSVSKDKKIPIAKSSQAKSFEVETNVADMTDCGLLNAEMVDSWNRSIVLEDAELCPEALSFEYPSGTPLIEGVLPLHYSQSHSTYIRKKSKAKHLSSQSKSISSNGLTSEYKLSSTPLGNGLDIPSVQTVIHSDGDGGMRGSPDGVEHPSPPREEGAHQMLHQTDKQLVVQDAKINKTVAVQASQTEEKEVTVSANVSGPCDPSLHEFCVRSAKQNRCTAEKSSKQRKPKGLRPDFEESFEAQVLRHLATVSSRMSELSEDSFDRSARLDEDKEVMDGRVSLDATVEFASSDEVSPNYCNAEIFLESGEVIELAVKVFIKEGEQLYKIFRVYENFHLGSPVIRFLMITSYAVYLLKKETECSIEKNNQTVHINSSRLEDCFKAIKTAPFRVIDGIFIGLNQQMFTIILKNEASNFLVCTGSESVTRAIMSSMEVAERRFGCGAMELPYVANDCTSQRVALATWSANEFRLGTKHKISLRFYGLSFWAHHECVDESTGLKGDVGRSGYLNRRYHNAKSWFKKHTPWKQSYFILRGHKLYEFDDSTCKIGIQVINLHDDVISCNESCSTEEHRHCMDVVLRVGMDTRTMQLQCHDRHDLMQWIINITCVLSLPDPTLDNCFDVSAGFTLVTESGVLIGQDTGPNHSFIRTLGLCKLHHIRRVILMTKKDIFIAQLYITSGSDAGTIWSISLASQYELDNLQKCLKELLGISIEFEELDEESETLAPFVCKETGNFCNFWVTGQ